MIPTIVLSLFLVSSGKAMLVQNDHKEPTVRNQFDNPEKDAAQAMMDGDLSLRGVNRFATVVPGISGDYSILHTKYKINVIENTSDVIVNDPKSYNNMAERYAFAYNRYVFSKLGCDPKNPMDKCKNYP
jgi:hypothetical protein